MKVLDVLFPFILFAVVIGIIATAEACDTALKAYVVKEVFES